MNTVDLDVLKSLCNSHFTTQRLLSESTGHSLGMINRSLRKLNEEGYVDDHMQLTTKAREEIQTKKPRNAIILAAGFGMRMVPINTTSPKALLEVNGERLIDRIIFQLKEAGITDITVVVGFMKDSFEYLMDEVGVELVYNPLYASSNNLHSLFLVADRICNTYIIPCDLWCDRNPFSTTELYSWYMVSELIDDDSDVRVNRKMELVTVSEKEAGNTMIGISYLLEPEALIIRDRLKKREAEGDTDVFWEETLYSKGRMIVQARVERSEDIVEINTYEQLRDLDSDSNQLKSDAIKTISEVLACKEDEITDISVLKKGMTNRSFLFTAGHSRFIMRIPGEGTDKLISRKQEAEVFQSISGLGLCDDPIYINPVNGYKITAFLEGVRPCKADSVPDLERCMDKLRSFHQLHLTVSHTFDIFGQINFYEQLWEGSSSIYQDYQKTKDNVFSLISYIDSVEKEWCLTHIDAVSDNFLFYTPEGEDEECLQLTDWEYAGMQDPHVDIAMFCIYSLYDRKQCDRLIDLYFQGSCQKKVRAKIYCYIAACGLLWSNWCEYKRKFGVEFGEYSLRQYRFAKDFFKYARELIEEEVTEEMGI